MIKYLIALLLVVIGIGKMLDIFAENARAKRNAKKS